MTSWPVTGNDNWNEDIIQWGRQYLLSHGYTLQSNLPENVQITPWSRVVRFATTDGDIYLKQTPKLIALEAIIIRILRDRFQASVPEVIAHNAELDCFLMHDAGKPLRALLKKRFDADLLCKAIDQFTALQLAVAEHVAIFLDIGVPDWRLDKLPGLYQQLLSQKELLRADGLSATEMRKLETLLPTISHLCNKLSAYAIKETIIQPDFHDNNLLINNASQTITLIDLGEIVISHPFFSLVNCLRQVKKHHGITEREDAYQQLVDACLNNYSHIASKEQLLDAFATAQRLWFVYEVLANERLMNACGKEQLMLFQPGKLCALLRELMFVCF